MIKLSIPIQLIKCIKNKLIWSFDVFPVRCLCTTKIIVVLFLFGVLFFLLFCRVFLIFFLCRQLLNGCSNHTSFVSFGFCSRNSLPAIDGPERLYIDVLDIRRPGRFGGFVQKMMVVIMHITW